jgi:signal transduction histidine kinase
MKLQQFRDIRSQFYDSIAYLDASAIQSAEYSQRHFRFMATLAVVVPFAYVVDLVVGRPYFDTFLPRLLAFILAVPLIFTGRPFAKPPPGIHWYFVGVATYILPFTYGFMLVANAASAPPGIEIEVLWILQYVVALFLFVQLIHNGILATLLWVVSCAAIALSLVGFPDINWRELERVVLYPITGYLTALFFGILTNRNVDYVNSEKLKAAAAIGANIAHELRTPLASIRSLARAFRRHSETLAEGYSIAREKGLITNTLNTTQEEGLRHALEGIEQEVGYSNTIIDMLLVNVSGKPTADAETEVLGVMSCMDEAIQRYPFNNSSERKLVRINIDGDFHVRAPRLRPRRRRWSQLLQDRHGVDRRAHRVRVGRGAVHDVQTFLSAD